MKKTTDMRQDYTDYIRSRFAAAKVNTDPFPHLILEDVLPPELYAAMEHDSPSTLRWMMAAVSASLQRPWREFEPRKMLNNAHLSQPVISLNDRTGTPALIWQSRRWKARYFSYVHFIHQQIVELFKDYSRSYLQRLVDWGLYPPDTGFIALEYEFCFRTKGWAIPPHTHNLAQTLQWMLYFPLEGSTENQGTQLYRVAQQKQIATKDLFGTTWFTDAGDAELALSVPYRKNGLIAFLNTPQSVHGSVPVAGAPARRYLFVGEWFDKPHNAAGPGFLNVSGEDFLFTSRPHENEKSERSYAGAMG